MTNQTKYFMNRKNLRLKHYDYSSDGAYFVTICVNNRECLFGDIIGGEIILNNAGLMVQNCYFELENKFKNIHCGEFVVMPNHFHCVIHLYNEINVGVNLCVDPKLEKGEHAGTPLHRIIQWFKTMTTNAYIDSVKTKNWQPFYKRLWQRNYYEHIIRNEQSYFEICQYIRDNPQKWEMDSLNPDFDK
ncbi:transposase [Francisella tularensis]|uniref:transposase n=1 Tax=Francisella tularensis TaxID=263 RepID=UPI0001855374|nr:transposase [Francisella tularensis]EDZ90018.1 hypothetical protein FTG_0207 [Francisella tularensis subsp. novicida FTG]MBK2334946.1 transposase [Francisella tularensis subsp. novicida]